MGRMRLRGTSSIALALLVSACSGRERHFITPSLPEDLDWIAVLFQDRVGELAESTPLVRGGAATSLSVEIPEEAVRALVVGYRQARLGLIELPDEDTLLREPIVLASPPEQNLLPNPSWTGAVDLDDPSGALSPWGEEAPRLSSSWAPSCSIDPCALSPFGTGELLPLPLQSPTGVRVAVPWPGRGDSALVTIATDFLRVSPEEAVELTELSTSTAYVRSDWRRSDGLIALLSSSRQHVAVGGPQSGFSTFARGDWDRIAISQGAGETTVFGARVGTPGGVERARQGQLETLYEVTTEDHVEVGASEDEALVSFRATGRLALIRGDDLEVFDAPEPGPVAFVPDLGWVVAIFAARGVEPQLAVLRDGSLEPLAFPIPPPAFTLDRIWPLPDGSFLYGGTRGELFFHHPRAGTCELEFLAYRNVNDFVPINSGGLFALGGADVEQTSYVGYWRSAPDRATVCILE